MIDITGDVHELQLLVKGLERLATPEARHELAERIAAAAKTLVALEFDSHTDPYGRKWAPLRSRAGQPLTDTGRLAHSFAFQAQGDDVRLGTSVQYAGVHQYGAAIKPKNAKALRFRVGGARPNAPGKATGGFVFAKKVTIPQRQMVPEGDLGPVWLADFETEVDAYLHELFPNG